MNAPRKKAAIAAYTEQFKAGEDVTALLAADEKKYTDAEIKEIVEALEAGDAPKEDAKKPATLNKLYEEWKVKPVYEKQRAHDGTMINVCTGFEKDAQKANRVTSVTPETAEVYNTQSENTLLRLYLVG